MRLIFSVLLVCLALGLMGSKSFADKNVADSSKTYTRKANTTQVFFGDTHLHTNYSFDAYLNLNYSADPDTAYRWAKGQPVIHPYNRARVRIDTPLDFLVVSDHAEMLGVMRAVREETAVFEDQGAYQNLKRWYSVRLMNRAIDKDQGLEFFSRFLPPAQEVDVSHADPVKSPNNNIDRVNVFGDTDAISQIAWGDIIATADRHNVPGEFTALIGWEWSSIPTGANLHRVVITPDGADKVAQFLPFGSNDSQYPEDLWQWLEDTERTTGTRFIAIPHNSNISKGYMFDKTTLRGTPIDAEYAQRRMQWEPVVEVTQIKGDSETNSQLSPEDEFADFENYTFYIQAGRAKFVSSAGDFIRPALKRGLAIDQKVGVNPYKFGLIGSSDSHSGLASVEENNFWGKMARDSTPETKSSSGGRLNGSDGWNMSASGLAAVWATENTREAIYAAFKRKEVYATTGPRLKVQLFGAWEFPKHAAESENFAQIGYQYGVPMGGDLTATKTKSAPSFILRAVKDPKGANLDRIQMIKGWINAEGEQFERVYNVAWSGQRKLDANGKLPAVGNTVDTQAATYTNNVGEAELFAHWVDPDFDPNQSAFYYARVLQIPTPRNALYDSLALGLSRPPAGPKTIQERAYTSPIWYQSN